jgi:hypothetical protein
MRYKRIPSTGLRVISKTFLDLAKQKNSVRLPQR